MIELIKRYKKILNYIVILIAVLVLVAKAPFTLLQIYEEQCLSNPNLKTFLYLESLYFFTVIVFFLIIYFRFDRDRFAQRGAFYIWIASFLYLLSRIPYGFDVTDQGYHLSKAWMLVNGDYANNIDMIWLTSFLGGLWLKIVGHPSILWARFGYSILVSLIIYINVKILFLYFSKNIKNILLLSITALFFIHYNYYLTINYDNLPLFIILLSAFFLLKNIKLKKPLLSLSVVSGALIGFSFFFKVSMLSSILIPIIVLLEYQINSKERIRNILTTYSAMGISVALMLFILFFSGYLNSFCNSFYNAAFEERSVKKELLSKKPNDIMTNSEIAHIDSLSYKENVFELFLTDSMKNSDLRKNPDYFMNSGDINSISSLFGRYKNDLWKTLQYFFLLVQSLLLLYFILAMIKTGFLKGVFVFISVGLLLSSNIIDFGTYPIFLTAYSLVLVVLYVGLSIITSRDPSEIKPLILVSILIFFTSFGGSNLSFITAFRSGGAMLLVSIAMMLSYNNFTFLVNKFNIKVNLKYNMFILIVLMFFSLKYVPFMNIHRDSEKKHLTQMFKSKELYGIFSTASRVNAVDSLMNFMISVKTVNHKAIFVGHLPMLYYLLDKELVLSSPWSEVENFEDFIKKHELLHDTELPSIAICSKISARSEFWPIINIPNNEFSIELKWYDYFNYFVDKNNYELKYQNSMFKVFIKE
ncbi:MAG: hypothetical protein KAS62_00015 [Candidatus Delongbacteria bacterium]|nr:hypothetical protein [Candidatus Delongbacteria bacterium]